MSLEPGPSNGDSPRRRSWWSGLATGSVKGKGKQAEGDAGEIEVAGETSGKEPSAVSRDSEVSLPPAYDSLATSALGLPTQVTQPRAKLRKSSKGAENQLHTKDDAIEAAEALRSSDHSETNVMAVTTQTVTTTTTTTTQIFPIFGRSRANSKAKKLVTASIEEAPPVPHRTTSKQLNLPDAPGNLRKASFDKDFPLLPSERPLPPLPGFLEKLSAVPPEGIVVTPSSPHKPYHPKSSVVTQQGPVPTPHLGLGLPSPMSRTLSDSPTITQSSVLKQQSVSSPLPSRSPSPVHKISFAEPAEGHEARSRQNSVDDESGPKRKQVKRTRSLSQLFGSAKAEEEPVQETLPVTASTGLLRGAAEWLGVRKPVRRRSSEGKLQEQAQGQAETGRAVSHADLPTPRNFSRSSSYGSAVESDALEVMLPASEAAPPDAFGSSPRPPRGQSLFARRTSSTGAEGKSHSPSPISSSHPSFVLPAVGAQSPMDLTFGRQGWVESPSANTAEADDANDFLLVRSTGNHEGRIRTRTNTWTAASSSSLSPLAALPEHGVGQDGLPKPVDIRPGDPTERRRAWSDAPPQSYPTSSVASELSTPMDEAPFSNAESVNSSESPTTPRRPSLGARSNSSNSGILTRVRSVLRPVSGRTRSSSLLRNEAGPDDFGALFNSKSKPAWMASSSSSSLSSPSRGASSGRLPLPVDLPSPAPSDTALPTPHRLRLPGSDGYRGQDSPLSSARSSMDRNVGWSGPTSYSTIPHDMSLPLQSHMPSTGNRARSSTVSAALNASPAAASLSSPRKRPGSLRRLSTGLFGGSSSPKAGGLFPFPPRPSVGSLTSTSTGPIMMSQSNSSQGSVSRSSRPSTSSFGTTTRKAVPRREEQELPSHWLHRLLEAVSRSEVANVLAVSGDEFHSQALKMYMNRFDFTHDALDVALRRLLMDIALPRETQQIDRVIEAFAKRYEECEPDLFPSKDTAYVLAFSLMMLHTDAFNRNNKNKMTKADYVRNTRMEGVPPVVLEVFFDNITFTPFVFIDDDTDVNGQRSLAPEIPALTGTVFTSSTSSSLAAPPKNNKVDVYHLIVRGITGTLRVNVQSRIPSESPFSCLGTRPFLDPTELHQSFANAHTLQIVAPKPRRKSSATLMQEPGRPRGSSIGAAAVPDPDLTLKVTKVGLLSRKDDLIEGGKKAGNRKWKSWSVILTGSQLLFFKDPTWALSLLDQARSSQLDGQSHGQLLFPRMTTFKPDEVFSVKDSIAIFDRSYTKYPNTFRFIMPHGRQYLLQASDEYELNEWMARINYAGAFKTASVRMRGMCMTGGQAVLAGAAAAASHTRAVQHGSLRTSRKTTIFGSSTTSGEVSSFQDAGENASVAESSKIDVEGANNVVVDDAEELAEAFNVVRSELAAGRAGGTRLDSLGNTGKTNQSRSSHDSSMYGHTSRIEAIELRVRDFKGAALPVETQLCGDLRLARNYAVLTPFQRVTRERIEAELPGLARRISLARVELAKLHFWIDVLEKDVEQEKRDWSRVRHVALQAAATSLREPGGVAAVVHKASSTDDGLAVPRLNLSEVKDRGGSRTPLGTSPGELPVLMSPPSESSQTRGVSSHRSSMSSFHSAQEEMRTDSAPSSPIAMKRRLPTRNDSQGEDGGLAAPRGSSFRTVSSPFPLLEREEPEDWQKTRAGRRVSLATMSQDQMRRLSQRRRPPPLKQMKVDFNDDDDDEDEATGHMDT